VLPTAVIIERSGIEPRSGSAGSREASILSRHRNDRYRFLSRTQQRLTAGGSLHGTVPRRFHARWMRTCRRRDSIDALQASDRKRLQACGGCHRLNFGGNATPEQGRF
jgi:glycine/D-amino acid oxidase-like deaminating enzyme